MARKTAVKTVTSPKNGAQLPVGAHPGNTGGKKGRSGRKPDAWRAELQAMVSSDEVLDALETVLKNPNHPAYTGAIKYASDHGFGKPKESVDVSHSGEVKVVQEWSFGDKKVGF